MNAQVTVEQTKILHVYINEKTNQMCENLLFMLFRAQLESGSELQLVIMSSTILIA